MRTWFSRRRRGLPEAVKKNIQSVARLEQEFERRRTPVDRVSDAITRFTGSVWSAVAHTALFAGWIVVNTGGVPGVTPFDPYPFSFLGLAVALEAIFLTTFVLMSQNRQDRQAEHWAHLELQVSLLAEQESTKMLQLLQRIHEYLGLKEAADDKELQELVEQTHVPTLAQELAKVRAVETELVQEAEKVRAVEAGLAQEVEKLREQNDPPTATSPSPP
jgi:uncharacterized membrane protein